MQIDVQEPHISICDMSLEPHANCFPGIHIAGDGKLAGLIDPNDGRCSLDNDNKYYLRGEVQDYPTIEQV